MVLPDIQMAPIFLLVAVFTLWRDWVPAVVVIACVTPMMVLSWNYGGHVVDFAGAVIWAIAAISAYRLKHDTIALLCMLVSFPNLVYLSGVVGYAWPQLISELFVAILLFRGLIKGGRPVGTPHGFNSRIHTRIRDLSLDRRVHRASVLISPFGGCVSRGKKVGNYSGYPHAIQGGCET